MQNTSLLPDDEELDLLHTRNYEARVYYVSDEELLVRGVVSDLKPPLTYIEGDPDALEMHQMQVELRVQIPGLTITGARVVFETHPHSHCPLIARDYEKLIGMSIARGFNHKIRDLFGGPRGCTHTNALLQAMAPAVVQSMWSISTRKQREAAKKPGVADPEERLRRVAANTNTCHVWAEDSDHMAAIKRGERSGYPPIPIRERLISLGRDPDEWF